MPVLRLTTTDPFLNLAYEEAILDRAPELGPTLVLWRNDPCVVIGRHQNPWVECDLVKMKADALPLVRRTSGGGAVYHDGGNTNFSFIAPSDVYDQDRHFRVVIAGLAALGIDAWKTERNDLRVGERKISGNAFRHTKGRSLHHGTLLVHADLDLLTAYLSPREALIETKATASVRSRVTNLADHRPGLTHEELWDALEVAFVSEYGEAPEEADARGSDGAPEPRESIPPRAAAPERDSVALPGLVSPEIRERAAELGSWEWVYGHTPAFVRRIAVPAVEVPPSDAAPESKKAPEAEVAITVKKGLIAEVAAEPPVGLPALRDVLVGLRYDAEAIESAAGELGGPGGAAELRRAAGAGVERGSPELARIIAAIAYQID